MTANVWMNPMIFDSTQEETWQKFMVFAQMMEGFGLDIMDQELLERIQTLTALYQQNK